jgi:hypothetical protein
VRAIITIEVSVDDENVLTDAIQTIQNILVYMGDNVNITHETDEDDDATA